MNRYLTIVYDIPDTFDVAQLTSHKHMSAVAWSHKMDECNRLRKERDRWLEECNDFWGKKSDADYEEIQALGEQLAHYRAVMEQAADDLEEAATEISDWGQYASEYFQEKHDLEDSVKRTNERAAALREALGGRE